MQKNTLIIGSSLVLVTAVVIYNTSSVEVTENKQISPHKETKTLRIIPQIKQIEQKIHPIETFKKSPEVKANINSKFKIKEEKFQSKYKLSILPENMSIQEKKRRFKELLIPAVNAVYANLEKEYNEVKKLLKNNQDKKKIQILIKTYQAKDTTDLLQRIKPHPKSIALAQSVMQSGWATSRFTLMANNLFGIWSFDENEPRVLAHETRDGKAIYVKRYTSLQESIEDYYFLLATSPLFEEFREQKMKTDDPTILIQSLSKYYKDGDNFTKGLTELITYNKFEDYDKN